MNAVPATLVQVGAPSRSTQRDARFWIGHFWLPLSACVAMLMLFSFTSLDQAVARNLFYGGHAGWIGAHTWWAEDFLHTGGRDLLRLLTVAALGLWFFGRSRPALREWASIASYFALCMILTVALAGLLKRFTNVDCPWDVSSFGGTRPYIHVFADRPDDLPHARCFPGAHSSSGFAVLALYFAFRTRAPRMAKAGLTAGLVLGALFSLAQQARGAHFLSHDLTSAFLAWFVSLAVYVRYRRSSWSP